MIHTRFSRVGVVIDEKQAALGTHPQCDLWTKNRGPKLITFAVFASPAFISIAIPSLAISNEVVGAAAVANGMGIGGDAEGTGKTQ